MLSIVYLSKTHLHVVGGIARLEQEIHISHDFWGTAPIALIISTLNYVGCCFVPCLAASQPQTSLSLFCTFRNPPTWGSTSNKNHRKSRGANTTTSIREGRHGAGPLTAQVPPTARKLKTSALIIVQSAPRPRQGTGEREREGRDRGRRRAVERGRRTGGLKAFNGGAQKKGTDP